MENHFSEVHTTDQWIHRHLHEKILAERKKHIRDTVSCIFMS